MIILCIACYTGVAETKNASKQIYHGSSVLTEKKDCFLGEILDSKRIIEPGDVAFTPHPLFNTNAGIQSKLHVSQTTVLYPNAKEQIIW